MAAEATRALKRLVDRLDPDQVGEVIGELVAAARSANDKKGRIRVVGFLASLVGEVRRALKSVAKDVQYRDVIVVVLVVLATAPELLIAAGVSVAALRVLTPLLSILRSDVAGSEVTRDAPRPRATIWLVKGARYP